MNPIEFKDGFRIGHDQIDAEHAGLVDLLNRCIEVLNTDRGRLAFVSRYELFVDAFQRHVNNEEQIMREFGYEESELEYELHQNALHFVESMLQDARTGTSLELILKHTLKLILEVILKADLPFKTHLQHLEEIGYVEAYPLLRSAE